MVKRKRDYKAEYARRKQIAAESGFPSVRSYKRERKRLSLPRRASLGIDRIRNANREWSQQHSRMPRSKWHEGFSDAQERAYFNAFPAQWDRDEYDKQALHDYLFDYDLITEDEWDAGPYPKMS